MRGNKSSRDVQVTVPKEVGVSLVSLVSADQSPRSGNTSWGFFSL